MGRALDQQVVLMEWYDLLYLALMKQDRVQLSSCSQSQPPSQMIATWDDPEQSVIVRRRRAKERQPREGGEGQTFPLSQQLIKNNEP